MAYWTCDECLHYDPEDTNYRGWGYCTVRNSYYPKSDRACNKFDNKPDYVKSGCFLTTTICDIFGFDDNCMALETMRNFRDNFLVKHCCFYPLLAEYEVIGPLISQRLYNDEHRQEIAGYYFENYIYDIVVNLKIKKDYAEAVSMYVAMVNDMKRLYGINQKVTSNDVAVLTRKIENNQYKTRKNS